MYKIKIEFSQGIDFKTNLDRSVSGSIIKDAELTRRNYLWKIFNLIGAIARKKHKIIQNSHNLS